jgi:hypothetical protein
MSVVICVIIIEADVQRTELVPMRNIKAVADEICESRVGVDNKAKADKLDLY